MVWSVLATPESLRLNDPINGHRAIRARLRSRINHAIDCIQVVSRDADGPPVSFRGGAQHLTVVKRHLLGINRDGASDRLWATGGRSGDLRGGHVTVFAPICIVPPLPTLESAEIVL